MVASSVKTILVLAANPKGTPQLRLDAEVREIQLGLERAQKRDQFVLTQRWAVRPRDVQRAMLDINPQIVHFSGHGAGEAGLVFEDETGQAKLVDGKALAGLFALFADKVECVVLNGCYSQVQAKSIAEYIPAVIGMNQAIGDQAALEFAVGFYDALGAGRSVEFAYRLGCSAISMAGISEEMTPVLVTGSTPAKITPPTPTSEPMPTPINLSPGQAARIFISYKRGVEPDEPLAKEVFQALSQHHQVFIDQTMPVGTHWAERIEAELRQADFLISFFSEHSVNSEMVKGEVETAYHLSKTQGKPTILPVRLTYRDPFSYPLSAYLNGINWAFWDSPADTSRLIAELEQAIAGSALAFSAETSERKILPAESGSLPQPLPSAQPAVLEMPEGSMDPESQFYVERPGDEIALGAIRRQGVTITIKGPRQMGKSSLLLRTVDAAIKANKRVVFLDFQLFDQESLAAADRFYRQFCTVLTEQLELPDRVADFWQDGLGNNQRCTRYLQTYVLRELNCPFLLAMDEVDRIFDQAFRSDFFSMLRSWHNNRASPLPAMRIWKQFDLVLVTATEPYHLIADLHQSPFNVGEVITLTDFTAEHLADLNRRHGSPLTPEQERKLMGLLHGHPYLVRKALYLVASKQMPMDEVLDKASKDGGPFGDHLRYHLFRIYDRPELVQGLLGVIRNQTCSDERIARLLTAAGLVRSEGQAVLPRCQLYADYFRERLER